jgi:hypothetical protein
MSAAPGLSSIQQQAPAKRAKVVDDDVEEVERLLASRIRRMRSGSGWPRPPATTKLPYPYLRRLATTKCGVRAGALPTTRMELLQVICRSLDDDDDNTNGRRDRG